MLTSLPSPTQLKTRRIRVSTTERTIDVTIGKYTRTFPFGLSYLISPGKSERPGVTSDLLAAARRSASQPTKARAISVTMKILRKVSMTALAIIRLVPAHGNAKEGGPTCCVDRSARGAR